MTLLFTVFFKVICSYFSPFMTSEKQNTAKHFDVNHLSVPHSVHSFPEIVHIVYRVNVTDLAIAWTQGRSQTCDNIAW